MYPTTSNKLEDDMTDCVSASSASTSFIYYEIQTTHPPVDQISLSIRIWAAVFQEFFKTFQWNDCTPSLVVQKWYNNGIIIEEQYKKKGRRHDLRRLLQYDMILNFESFGTGVKKKVVLLLGQQRRWIFYVSHEKYKTYSFVPSQFSMTHLRKNNKFMWSLVVL